MQLQCMVVDGTARWRTGPQREPMRFPRASLGRRLHRVPVGLRRQLVRRLQPTRSQAERPILDSTRRRPSSTLSTVSQDELCARRRTTGHVGRSVVASTAAGPEPIRSTASDKHDDGVIGDVTSSSTSSQVTWPSAAAAAANCTTDHVDYSPASEQPIIMLFPRSVCNELKSCCGGEECSMLLRPQQQEIAEFSTFRVPKAAVLWRYVWIGRTMGFSPTNSIQYKHCFWALTGAVVCRAVYRNFIHQMATPRRQQRCTTAFRSVSARSSGVRDSVSFTGSQYLDDM